MSKQENNMENNVEDNEPNDLIPISHKDFNEFIRRKGFIGRNNYKLREVKAMFGFKPLTYKNQATVTIDDANNLELLILYLKHR